MTLTAKLKKSALLIAASTTLIACDALQITGGPLDLDIGAAQANNLLDRGGFDGGFGAWRACSDPSTVTLSTNDINTVSSAQLSANGCIYQAVPAAPNDFMIASCSARKATNNWASMTFGYLDKDHQPLKTIEAPIPDTNFTTISARLRAPADTAYAEVLIYAEDGAVIDDCELVNMQEGAPAELLINAWFEEGLNGWQACPRGSVTVDNDVANLNESCLSQKFTAYEGAELTVSCNGVKLDDSHTALALGFLDATTQAIEMIEVPITREEGVYPSVTLTAPASTSYAQVMLYTEGEANIRSCSLTQPEES